MAAVFFIFALPLMGAAQLRISTDKDSLDFTKVKLGFSRDGIIKVFNISLATVNVNDMTVVPQSAAFGEFQIIVPQPPVFHVDSGDSRTISIRFLPSAAGFRSAALEIFTDDGIKQVELVGEGSSTQPDILMKPQFIDFGKLAPGEFKDTTLLIIGGNKDSATIEWINVANDNAAIHFDVSPLDPLVTFPIGIKSGDTVKLNVRFSAFNFSGPRTGRAMMEGEVSGEVLCEFRGEVAVPNMVFTPELLDLGVIPQGSVVDTFISIASTGETSVKLQEVLPPGLPYYSISNVPSLPYLISPQDSLKIGVHFSAEVTGDWEGVINAYSKNGSAARINKSALIKAIVVPRVLAKISSKPFIVSCAIDSLYSRTLAIMDTGNFAIAINAIATNDPDFSVNYPSSFPDTIVGGGKRNITITFKPVLGSVITNKTCIVNILSGGRVIISDTILLQALPENALLHAAPITVSNPVAYANSIGIVTVSDLMRYKLTSLEMEMTIDPPDVAEIDTLNTKINTGIFPNAAMKITFDRTAKKYLVTINSSTIFPASAVIPFLQIPLRYFVAKDSSATLRIITRSPEKDGCLNFAADSISVPSAGGCGDGEIRRSLNNIPLISSVSISPNPSRGNVVRVSFVGTENLQLSLEIIDINGKNILNHAGTLFTKGQNSYEIGVSGIISGEYTVHLAARTQDGRSQDVFENIILTR